MAERRNSSLSLKPTEDDLLTTAAEMLFLHKADFVRLAVRKMAPDLEVTFSNLAALHAQRLFIDKAWARWGIPFEEVDFRQPRVQQWLREMTTETLNDGTEVTGNNFIPLDPAVGCDSAFDKYRKDENPRIAAARARNSQAFMNSPTSPPSVDLATLFFKALITAPEVPKGAAIKHEVRSMMHLRIQTEFEAITKKFRAIPNLLFEAKKLGATPSFLTLYRNDPETLFRLVSHERFQETTRAQALRELENPQSSLPPVATLIEKAKRLGATDQFIEAHREDSKALQRYIINRRKGHSDDLWLTSPPSSIVEYAEFLLDSSPNVDPAVNSTTGKSPFTHG